MRLVQLFLCVVICAPCISVDMHSSVSYFEKLETKDVTILSRTKRSSDGETLFFKEAEFKAFGRDFRLILFPGSPVLSSHFTATTVGKGGKTRQFYVDQNKFFSGHLKDDPRISVDAHMEEDIFCCSVYFHNDTYVLEPAWRHRHPWETHTIMAYRSSDVNWDEILPFDSYVGNRTFRMGDGFSLDSPAFQKTLERLRRESSNERGLPHNTCGVLIVSDFLFYRDVGRKDRSLTATNMIAKMQKVDTYFRSIIFNRELGMVNIGLEVDKLRIHTTQESSDGCVTSVRYHMCPFNADWDYWTSNQKLFAFSRLEELPKFCIGHLFTSFAFESHRLGLAFRGFADETSVGICAQEQEEQSHPLFPLTGFSTVKLGDRLILGQQHTLVIMHETGHLFGATHDPVATDRCSPLTFYGGRFLMYPQAVMGYDHNNFYFSECSVEYISAVLAVRQYTCLRPKESLRHLCGNGIIEHDEQCDIGVTDEASSDRCCDQDCKLRENAVCSDFNHVCCRRCQIAPNRTVCSEPYNGTCQDTGYCDGVQHNVCPVPKALPYGTHCLDDGVCVEGKCQNFCYLYGLHLNTTMESCLCITAKEMCDLCCRTIDGSNTSKVHGTCISTSNKLRAGRECYIGYCNNNGVCVSLETLAVIGPMHQTSDLFWFLKDNIVFTVVLVCAMVWIPTSLYVSYKDSLWRAEMRAQRKRLDEKLDELAIVMCDIPRKSQDVRNEVWSRLGTIKVLKNPERTHSQVNSQQYLQLPETPKETLAESPAAETSAEPQAEPQTEPQEKPQEEPQEEPQAEPQAEPPEKLFYRRSSSSM